MKKIGLICLFGLILFSANAQKKYAYPMPEYTPTAGNLEAREEFQDMKFGMFIHWGVYSILADGEWVMLLKKIQKDNYSRLADFLILKNLMLKNGLK
ncbi:alpha-L-fucosidase [Algibacter lectus]|uniref:Alpha-L-fucosidase n=2 Tax=Algibacter lectus TaxID=221126 RepID=A0A090VLX0_9FLAO|nr:alpha-L-fucosidase [Algibacter lectus]